MANFYDFFNREFYDPIWLMAWPEFIKLNGTRWAKSKKYEPGEYVGTSLTELVCFCLEEEPSDEELKDILERRTIRWTIQRCDSAFFLMSELMCHVPGHRSNHFVVEESEGGVLIAAATAAYLGGKTDAKTLRAVLMACGSPPEGWLSLTRKQKALLAEPSANIDYMKPLYRWQAEGACCEGEGVTCLGIPDTRRFVAFIENAYSGNWEVMKLLDAEANKVNFRDFEDAEYFHSAARKMRRTGSPSVFRTYS